MKKIILSALFLGLTSPIVAMEKAPAKKEDEITVKKSSATAETEKIDKSQAKKHSLFACLACESEAQKK